MNPKVSAKTGITATGSTGGAIIIVWLLSLFGIEIEEYVAVAIAGLIAGVIGYFVPAKSGKYIDLDAAEGYEPVYAVESDDEDDILEDEEEVENVAH